MLLSIIKVLYTLLRNIILEYVYTTLHMVPKRRSHIFHLRGKDIRTFVERHVRSAEVGRGTDCRRLTPPMRPRVRRNNFNLAVLHP